MYPPPLPPSLAHYQGQVLAGCSPTPPALPPLAHYGCCIRYWLAAPPPTLSPPPSLTLGAAPGTGWLLPHTTSPPPPPSLWVLYQVLAVGLQPACDVSHSGSGSRHSSSSFWPKAQQVLEDSGAATCACGQQAQ